MGLFSLTDKVPGTFLFFHLLHHFYQHMMECERSKTLQDFKILVDKGFAKCEVRLERLETDFIEIKTLLEKLLAKGASSAEAMPTAQDSPTKLSQSEAPEDIKQEMIENFEINRLYEYLTKQWETYVPKVMNKKVLLEKERNIDSVIISALERFLTRSQDPKAEIKVLQKANTSHIMCGKQVDSGDEFYTCDDCAIDLTIGLCSECFQKSLHTKHRYQVKKSSGGYCDCGDAECWISGHACKMHKEPDQSNVQGQDPEVLLKADMKLRAEQLFEVVMLFSHAALTSSENESITGAEDAPPEDEGLYCTMLSHSELFTKEQILNILINVWDNCTIEEADSCVAKLVEDGKVCIHKGEKSECERVAQLVVEESTKIKNPPLDVKVIKYKTVVQAEIAYELLCWVKKMINLSDGLKCVFYRTFIRPDSSGGPPSLLERFLLDDSKISQASRTVCHQIYMDAIVRNGERKTEFAMVFTRLYPALISNLLKAQPQVNPDSSVTSLAVQLYMKPSVTKILLLNQKVLEVILKTILDESQAWIENGVLVFKDSQDIDHFRALLQSFHDLRYILSSSLTNIEWTAEARSAILDGFKLLLDFLSLVKGMDAAKVPIKGNLEIKKNWVAPYTVQMHVDDCSNLFIKLCSSDMELLKRSYSMILNRLSEETCNLDTRVTIKEHTAECCSFDVQEIGNQTTIFLPMHRLFAALYIKLPDDIGYTSECFVPLNQSVKLSAVLEFPLRVLVLLAQVESQMWNTKGDFAVQQVLNYKCRAHRQEMFDRDVQLLQVVASLMDPNEFMIHLVYKFNLTSIFTNSSQYSLGFSEKNVENIIDKFLLLLIMILGERYVEGIGCVDQETVMKREIIHHLATNEVSYTDMKRVFSSEMDQRTNFEGNLRTVACVDEKAFGETMCKLRTEYYDWLNPCFHHYNNNDERDKAEKAYRKLKQEKGLSSVFAIPKPPKLCAKFASLSALLKCDLMLHIMTAVILEVLQMKTKVFTEVHLEKVLHLITLGIHEDRLLYESGDVSLPFTIALQETKTGEEQKTIIELLEQCSNGKSLSKKSTKDLCQHTLESWNNVLNLRQQDCVLQ